MVNVGVEGLQRFVSTGVLLLATPNTLIFVSTEGQQEIFGASKKSGLRKDQSPVSLVEVWFVSWKLKARFFVIQYINRIFFLDQPSHDWS